MPLVGVTVSHVEPPLTDALHVVEVGRLSVALPTFVVAGTTALVGERPELDPTKSRQCATSSPASTDPSPVTWL